MLSDFFYKVDLHLFFQNIVWSNIDSRKQIKIQPINKSYKSFETEEQFFLKLEVATPCEITAMKPDSQKKAELWEIKLFQIFSTSNKIIHRVPITEGQRGNIQVAPGWKMALVN